LPSKVIAEVKLPFLRRIFDPTAFNFSNKHVAEWNKNIDQLKKNEKVAKHLESFFETHVTIASLKLLLFQLVANLNSNHTKIDADDVRKLVEHLMFDDDKVKLMTGLSVLEICLLIAIKHHCDIYDNDPFNFEMILTRFNKFAIKSSTMQNIDREMVLKRFENLKHQEFIVAIGVEGKVQKEYQMHKLLLFADQIDKAIQKYQNLPTEVDQWARSSII
jgi:origin recognition complex subunit 4